MEAKEPEVGSPRIPLRLRDELREANSRVVALEGETGDGDLEPRHLEPQRSRAVEKMQSGVRGEQGKGDGRALVVAGHHDYRHAPRSDLDQGLQRAVDELAAYAAAVEEVSAVNHEIDSGTPCRLERKLEIAEEVGSAPAPLDARPQGHVESEVGIGQQQKAQRTHLGIIRGVMQPP